MFSAGKKVKRVHLYIMEEHKKAFDNMKQKRQVCMPKVFFNFLQNETKGTRLLCLKFLILFSINYFICPFKTVANNKYFL